jgi:hypothetical protein
MVLKSPAFTVTCLVLMIAATLFPPFHWGEEEVRTEAERRSFRSRHREIYDQMPIKTYSFLLGASSRAFLEWTWDGAGRFNRL